MKTYVIKPKGDGNFTIYDEAKASVDFGTFSLFAMLRWVAWKAHEQAGELARGMEYRIVWEAPGEESRLVLSQMLVNNPME